MTPYKYLCIDDAPKDVAQIAQVIADGSEGLFEIEVVGPEPFDLEVQRISSGGYDGILLDLRLDEYPSGNMTSVQYRATALAQELRTRMTEGALKPMPLLLWSSNEKISKSYNPDVTGQDLFDVVLFKGRIEQRVQAMRKELVALAEGYAVISNAIQQHGDKAFARILDPDDVVGLPDPRLGEELQLIDSPPVHNYAAYVLKNVIHASGVLIDEKTLSVRLGIDIEKSKGWLDLCSEALKHVRYRGVFEAAWDRFWMHRLQDWWHDVLKQRDSLERTTAQKRVEVIKERTGIANLEALGVSDASEPARFWYVCRATNKPIDPLNAVEIVSRDKPKWVEGEYVSMEAIKERKHREHGLKIHPLEIERVRGALAGD